MNQLIRQESYYCVLRDDGDKYTLQELPIDYCKITGRWENGLLFDFNMMWFISQPGVDINMYPDVFKKYYKRIIDAQNNGYNPSNNTNNRIGEWVYWVQTSPEDNVWAWKFNQDQIGQVPFLAPIFPDLVLTPMIRNLQKNKYIIEASKVLIGLIGFNKDNKSGNVKDALNLDPETAGKFAGLIRQGLTKEIQFGFAPFEDIKQFDFSNGNSKNMLAEHNTNSVSESGINSRLIYSLDKQNAEETRNSISVDEYLLNYIYPYFNNFLDYYINKKTSKYKFRFHFEGSEFRSSRQNRLDDVMKLLDKGMVLPQKISAAIGMQPHEFERQLAMARGKKFVDKLTPVLSSYTLSSKDY